MYSNIQNSDDYDIRNISDYLRLNAEKFPDKPALLYPEKISYSELEIKVNRYAYYLDNKGIKAGVKTILLVPAGPEFFILTFALLRIGAIPVMIDPGMGIKAMVKALTDVRPEAFIGIPGAHLLRLLYPDTFRTVKVKIIPGNFLFSISRRSCILPEKRPVRYPAYLSENSSIAAIFFTSGSTGPPKGVIYTAGMLRNQINVTKTHFKIGSDEIDLCTFPLLGLFALCHGNSSVIADMDMLHPAKLDPAKVIKNIQDHGCTQMFGSPMILNKLSQYGSERGIKLPSLRNVMSAGAPVHRIILESFSKMINKEAMIHTPYGATEALPVTDIHSAELLQINPAENEAGICVGYPVEGIDIKIIEISDKPINSWNETNLMPFGEIGEIVVKGPWVAGEYLNNIAANALSKIMDLSTNEIWHRMGDLGRIDSHGRIWFAGRKSQRVVTSDRTLYTIPCEAVFNSHPSVARSALVGIPVNETGLKKPVICIQLKPGIRQTRKLSEDLLKRGMSSKLTDSISDIFFYKKFPVDPRHNAKIFREKLAEWTIKRIR